MTKDICLDNSHQVKSLSANDQVSDEPYNSKNTDVSNGVNSVQKFNVDVNDQQNKSSANGVIVRNCSIDADGPPILNVSTTHFESPIDSKLSQRIPDNLVKIIDEKINKSSNNIVLPAMTVITQQNSSENIREILTNSEKNNAISSPTIEENYEKNNRNSDKYSISGKSISHSGALKKKLYTSKSDHKNKSENDKSEDPIERLNKLRASISSALSEVKGVLKQYSTDQNNETENETTPSSQTSDNGPVRFRFVRKIRRRSTFSEDQIEESEVEKHKTELSLLSEKNSFTEFQNQISENPLNLNETDSEIKRNELNEETLERQSIKNNEESNDTIEYKSIVNEIGLIKISDNSNTIAKNLASESNNDNPTENKNVLKISQNCGPVNENYNPTDGSINKKKDGGSPIKSLTLGNRYPKPKKKVNEERRASIAVVEKVPEDLPSVLDNLKNQRRPSDSMTLVKQSARTNIITGNISLQNLHSKGATTNEVQGTKSAMSAKVEKQVVVLLDQNTDLNSPNKKLISFMLNKTEAPDSDKTSMEKQIQQVNTHTISGRSTDLSSSLKSIKEIQQSIPTTQEIEIAVIKPKAPDKTELVSKLDTQNNVEAKYNSRSKFPVLGKASKIEEHEISAIMLKSEVNVTKSLVNPCPDDDITKQREKGLIQNEGEAINIPVKSLEGKQIDGPNLLVPPPTASITPHKKKRKAKRKVVIRRLKRKLSKDDTFIQVQETPTELEICEKEIEEICPDNELNEIEEVIPEQRKSCLKARQFEIGDTVMYAERYKKTQVKWKKATVTEKITSISYKLDINGDEVAAHISYIKKYTDRKVNFGGKEYLEIDYAQIEEDEEKEKNYSIWNLV